MMESDVSGVMFTANPVNYNINEIMIEAGYGLGEYLVQGKFTPSNFLVDKKLKRVKESKIVQQDKMLVFQNDENKEIHVS